MIRDTLPARLSGLLLAFGLAGCMVGPNYTKPSVQLEPFHNQAPDEGPAPAPKLDTWWTGFDDPMLVTVVQRAPTLITTMLTAR